MTFIVTENCIRCKYTDCEPVRPAKAIGADSGISDEQQQFAEINRALSAIWPSLAERKPPLPDDENWDGVSGKLQYLEGAENAGVTIEQTGSDR